MENLGVKLENQAEIVFQHGQDSRVLAELALEIRKVRKNIANLGIGVEECVEGFKPGTCSDEDQLDRSLIRIRIMKPPTGTGVDSVRDIPR